MRNLLITILLCAASETFLQAQANPEMVKVAGGTFTMGDEKGIGEPDERPVHTVTLKNFSMAKAEVTVLQWRTYCKAIQREMPDAPEWCSDYLDKYKAYPVSNPTGAATRTFVVRRGGSWDDAVTRNRSTYRIGNSFRRSYHSLGFRVASSD